MEMNIKHVHVGAEIEKRRVELGLSKSELGRRIGVPQQRCKPHLGEGNYGNKPARQGE